MYLSSPQIQPAADIVRLINSHYLPAVGVPQFYNWCGALHVFIWLCSILLKLLKISLTSTLTACARWRYVRTLIFWGSRMCWDNIRSTTVLQRLLLRSALQTNNNCCLVQHWEYTQGMWTLCLEIDFQCWLVSILLSENRQKGQMSLPSGVCWWLKEGWGPMLLGNRKGILP